MWVKRSDQWRFVLTVRGWMSNEWVCRHFLLSHPALFVRLKFSGGISCQIPPIAFDTVLQDTHFTHVLCILYPTYHIKVCWSYLWHLRQCVPSGAQHHHGQGCRDAERREEDVRCLVVLAQPFEHGQGEGVVGLRWSWLCHCAWHKEERKLHN